MRYYVYELVVMPDSRVCYVGKGSGQRMYDHVKMARRKSDKNRKQRPLYRDILALLQAGKSIEPRVIFETDDELLAFHFEARRIREIGFENLFNRASHAFIGRTLKEDTKAVLAEESRRMWRDPDYRAKNHTVRGLKFPNRKRPSHFKFPKNHADAKYRGVSRWVTPGKSPRWMISMTIEGKHKTLGYRNSLLDALQFYDNEAEKRHGVRPNATVRSKQHG